MLKRLSCEEVRPNGVFEAVLALRGHPKGEGSQCRYGIGSPRSPDFRFCDNDAKLDSAYCQHHFDICNRPRG